jgi:hypothetical protein
MKPLPLLLPLLLVTACNGPHKETPAKTSAETPHIVNIINFIRDVEPRIEWITKDVLYETVEEQVKILKEYNLPGTFLLQYDALIDPRYQELMKSLPLDQFEIGAWWEIPQPLVENSGYHWRGRYPWDWHANVGFATGYTPEEREKLVDTYMTDFKKIFGYYPKSAGSWFIDAHTLGYMYDKYGIQASCNCKDQIGTDGYTMWGGYWNQAYYPSRKNAYMPAQDAENQIPVPIFRMLGSDPIYQYDAGLGGQVQHVVSLEPVYRQGGGNQAWCDWYYHEFVNGPCITYAYVQAGQENSFTWKRMEAGFRIQMPIISQLRKEGKVVVETLGQSGEWFKKNFPVTPPTSVCALSDHTDKNLKTVWFNSRFYRANLLWEKGTLRFRDIHQFDESVASDYLTQPGTTESCNYYTLPVVDGFRWSTGDKVAGLRFRILSDNGLEDILGGDPIVENGEGETLKITWPVTRPSGQITIVFSESAISVTATGRLLRNLVLELSGQPGDDFPVIDIHDKSVAYKYFDHPYTLTAATGSFTRSGENGSIFEIKPVKGKMVLRFTN